jgi:hypothetical protein
MIHELDINIVSWAFHVCAQLPIPSSRRQALNMATSKRDPRILMLHGYGQNGAMFRRKVERLMKSLGPVISQYYNVTTSDLQLVFPDGPISLKSSDPQADTTEASPRSVYDGNSRSWWYNLDTVSDYPGIELSLAALKKAVADHGPFTGVIGFSQGAALAGIFTSWCESGSSENLGATFKGGNHLSTRILGDLLSEKPQPPLDFAVFLSGFCATAKYYSGFYLSTMCTPTVHATAEYDTMVEHWQTRELIQAFEHPQIVEHQGVHHVPTEKQTIDRICSALQHAMSRDCDNLAEVDSQADTIVSSASGFDQTNRVVRQKIEYSRSRSSITRRCHRSSKRPGVGSVQYRKTENEPCCSTTSKSARRQTNATSTIAHAL